MKTYKIVRTYTIEAEDYLDLQYKLGLLDLDYGYRVEVLSDLQPVDTVYKTFEEAQAKAVEAQARGIATVVKEFGMTGAVRQYE